MYTRVRYSTVLRKLAPPRYLSEFLFGGRVAGRVIYYLFEILYFIFMGEFAAGRVIFYLLEILTTGRVGGRVYI